MGWAWWPIPHNDSDARQRDPTPRNASLGLRTLYTYYFARSITQFSNTPHPPSVCPILSYVVLYYPPPVMGPIDTPRNTLYIPERAGLLLFSCVGVGRVVHFLLRWLTPHPLAF